MSMLTAIPLITLLFFAFLFFVAYTTSSIVASRAFMGALVFAGIGPPIGTLVFFAEACFMNERFHIVHVLFAFIPAIYGAFLIGLLPAATVGACVGALSTRLKVFPCCLLATLLGLGASVVLAGNWQHGIQKVFVMMWPIIYPSVFASIMATLVFYVAIVSSNTVFPRKKEQ